jgi:hypothetical protein
MSILKIENFKYGLDSRRNELAATLGTLAGLENAHINQGGEVEKRRGFDTNVAVVDDSFGLEGTSEGLVVFAWPTNSVVVTELTDGTPLTVKLLDPGVAAVTLTEIVSSCVIQDTTFVIAKFSNDEKYLFFGTTLVNPLPTNMTDPTCCIAFKNQVFVLSGQYIFASKVNEPLIWTGSDLGVTELNIGQHGTGYEEYITMKPYQDKLAIFSDLSIQIWNIDPDDAKWAISQVLNNTGIVSSLSAVGIGELDTIYLSPSGVRSLRARESTLNAITTDIGSPVDQRIIDKLATCTQAELNGICGVAEPLSSRYWLFVKDTIYVLSYYPTLKITAWSEYTPSVESPTVTYLTFTVSKFLIYRNRLFLRAYIASLPEGFRDVLLFHGQLSSQGQAWEQGLVYDYSEVEIETPWLDMNEPTYMKMVKGIDAVFDGTWSVYAKTGYRNANTAWELVAENVTAATPEGQFFSYVRACTHLKLKFTTTSQDRPTLSSIMIHFNKGADR